MTLTEGARHHASDFGPLLGQYRPPAGAFDELIDADGAVRPHWLGLLSTLAGQRQADINRAFSAADRHLRESGVFYRIYDDPVGAVRPWPLSHLPLLIDPVEWRELKEGLVQRARLIEAVLADIYGPAQLVRDGRIPAAVIAGNPEFLRPLVGVDPPGGAFLRFYAVDLGRSPTGQWWVLGDRTQAPSGAGYALENRIALSRALPNLYRDMHIERVAPFFQAFQSELTSLNRREDSRVSLLTPGPMNETYFEHAYIARYLGFLLVEGEDLTARDDGVFVRTVSGLKRADVILRRLDSDFADPLELSVHSRLGVPGLVQAVRDGKVVLANGLGTGVIESRAMLGFLPALAHAVLDEDLKLPNIATWWLGDPAARADALARINELVISPAFATNRLQPQASPDPAGGQDIVPATRDTLIEAVTRRGIDYVAQEDVALSTTPVWQQDRFVPRPFILRVFLARTADGWSVMPGGFVRIADDLDARAVSLQAGGRTADAWVLSDKPIVPTTLLQSPDHIAINRSAGALTSRAASNLLWLSRYAERAEATLRLARALINRATEDDSGTRSVNRSTTALLAAWNAIPDSMLNVRPALVVSAALQRADLSGALPFLANAAYAAASVIRDRFSPDAWRALADLADYFKEALEPHVSESALFDRINGALRIISSFSGLAQENMSQLTGWRFMELGRRIERTLATSRFLRQFAFGDESGGGLDVMLELADSQITYRRRYVMVAARAPVIDLVALDPNNPRSMAYQLARIANDLAALPKRGDGRLSPPEQIATALSASLVSIDVQAITGEFLLGVENSLMKLADAIAVAYFATHERSDESWDALA